MITIPNNMLLPCSRSLPPVCNAHLTPDMPMFRVILIRVVRVVRVAPRIVRVVPSCSFRHNPPGMAALEQKELAHIGPGDIEFTDFAFLSFPAQRLSGLFHLPLNSALAGVLLCLRIAIPHHRGLRPYAQRLSSFSPPHLQSRTIISIVTRYPIISREQNCFSRIFEPSLS